MMDKMVSKKTFNDKAAFGCGSVLVLGGGISGIQAALDLADSGFKVYLVENKPSIGGVMPQLDKTFPTNDCAMCILAPKLVTAGRHQNIELLTYSEIMECSGEAGNFSVTIKKNARSIDTSKCTGCGTCQENCLVRYIPQKPKPSKKAPLEDTFSEALEKILGNYPKDAGSLLSILEDINDAYNYLPEQALEYVSDQLSVPLSRIYEVATFYKSFTLRPRGTYTIKVCLGTACYVRGANKILSEFERKLAIQSGQTTEDLSFTLESVNCVGACAIGPTIMVNELFYGGMTPQKVDELISELRSRP
jgi:NADH:ubiquinone oxidoreductase subunit E